MNDIAACPWISESPARETKAVRRRIHWPIALVMLVTMAVYVGTCAWPVILDETDGQYAGAAREMLARGDWLVPTNNGVPRLQKPPLVYWLTMASLKVFGVNEFAARLPNALATVAWVFATYLIGKRIGGEKRGLVAATILASMMGLFLFTHRIMPEPFLATFITLTVWCFLNALSNHQPKEAGSGGLSLNPPPYAGGYRVEKWFFWAWVFMGFGALSKGLHGALWPLLIAGVSAILQPSLRSRWKGLASWLGIAAFLLIAVPWYAAMAARFPGFLSYHFFNEQAGHAFNTHSPRDCEQVPLVTFWAQHILYLFPWIFFLPAALLVAKSKRSNSGFGAALSEEQSREKLLWIWIGITAITISFSARQDHYSMTSWGAMAVFLALPMAERGNEQLRRKAWTMAPAVAMAAVGGVIVVAAMALTHPVLASATQVQPEAARDDIYSAIHGLSFVVWRHCAPLAIAAGLAFMIGGGLAAILLRQGRTMPATFLLAGTMALVFPFAMRGYAQTQGYFSLADAARAINSHADADALVVCEGEPHLSASLFFYLNGQVAWAGPQTGSVVAAESHGIAVGPFVSDDQLAAAWHSDRQVFFIVEESNLQKWRHRLSIPERDGPIIARNGTRVVVTNRAPRESIENSAG